MPRQREDDRHNLLRAYRELKNMTQQEVSERVGVSRTLWSAWEGQNRPIGLAQLNKIREVLELKDDMIIELLDWWGGACFED